MLQPYIESATAMSDIWASEASPTMGCSIEISRDIYLYMCVGWSVGRYVIGRSVCMSVMSQNA